MAEEPSVIPLYGLILTGGHSTRMQQDKALLHFNGRPHLAALYDLLAGPCDAVWVSSRTDQADTEVRDRLPQIHDSWGEIGPMGGLLSAFQAYPRAAWMVVACDMPFVDEDAISHLVRSRDTNQSATCYLSLDDSRPEPLCTIYEPVVFDKMAAGLRRGDSSLRRFLESNFVRGVVPSNRWTLRQVNNPDDFRQATEALALRGHA